jgi:hypothetical protein
MEKKIISKIDAYVLTFKNDVRAKAHELDIITNPQVSQLLQYMYDYHRLILKKDDFAKKKRNKISIEPQQRCIAKRSNGEQCTRKKKNNLEFCGTHAKGIPHGICETVYENNDAEDAINEIEVRSQEINGIMYFIDLNSNVYQTEDVLLEVKNPKIIGTYVNDANGVPSVIYNDSNYDNNN